MSLRGFTTIQLYCLNIIDIYLEDGFLSVEICFWILGFISKSAIQISNSTYRFPNCMHPSEVL